MLIVGLAASSLLGQGEICQIDPRFVSPSATLTTYWEAMRTGDAEAVWACSAEAREDLPMPGMLWFLPPTESLRLDGFRSLPITGGRVMVSYDVVYVPAGARGARSFRAADELVRDRGEWRIARPLGHASMPDWVPSPRPVDS